MQINRTVGLQVRRNMNQFYERVEIDHCIYCGDEWEVLDHVPPVTSYVRGEWAFKYPACKECNSILGTNPFKDIRIRRYFILKRLFKKYGKLLRMPNWNKIEKSEIKGYIRSFVKESEKKKSFLLKRIEHLTENYVCPNEIERKTISCKL